MMMEDIPDGEMVTNQTTTTLLENRWGHYALILSIMQIYFSHMPPVGAKQICTRADSHQECAPSGTITGANNGRST
jgi:hypothetical protein